MTLRRVQPPPRRIEVEERGREMQGDTARAYLRLVEEKHEARQTPCRFSACSPCMIAWP